MAEGPIEKYDYVVARVSRRLGRVLYVNSAVGAMPATIGVEFDQGIKGVYEAHELVRVETLAEAYRAVIA